MMSKTLILLLSLVLGYLYLSVATPVGSQTMRCGVSDSDGARLRPEVRTKLSNSSFRLGREHIIWNGGRWNTSGRGNRPTTIPYAFDYDRVAELGLDRSQVSAALKQAFDTWAAALEPVASPDSRFNEVDWRPVVRQGPGIRTTTRTYKTFIRVSWATDRHERILSHQTVLTFDANSLAHALIPQTEMITEDPDKNVGAVCFNTRIRWSLDGVAGTFDIVSVAIHEIGHALGLGHSDDPASIMFPTISGGSQKRQLTVEDRGIIRQLYPR